MPAFTWTIRVRYHECDPQGIVFNAHYFTFFDMTITELLRAAFPAGGYGEMIERLGVDIVVAEATARFRGSARFDEDIELSATVTRLGTTGMTTELSVARAGTVLVEGELRHVFVDATTWTKTPIPDAVRAALAPWSQTAGHT
jgi:acyl-CoA thioester hydrolase